MGMLRQLRGAEVKRYTRESFRGMASVPKSKLFHRSARHGHVRIKNVALGHPLPVHLLRGQHPFAVVNMGTVSARDHIRPSAVADVAAAVCGSNGDLDLGEATILAGLELCQDRISANDGFLVGGHPAA